MKEIQRELLKRHEVYKNSNILTLLKAIYTHLTSKNNIILLKNNILLIKIGVR